MVKYHKANRTNICSAYEAYFGIPVGDQNMGSACVLWYLPNSIRRVAACNPGTAYLLQFLKFRRSFLSTIMIVTFVL
jgi:hypothetical protein